MIDVSTARKIALSMPQAEERQHHAHPDFRVKNKIFATLWPTQARAVIKLSVGDQTKLLQSSPRTFSTNAWSRQGWTNVHLQHISAKWFRDLVENSWRHVAPKRLIAEHDSGKHKKQPLIN
jgi:hypothetical protein